VDFVQISTVTNVQDSRTALEDSRTTIRQGNNIRVLTLVTISYLPLGFVTVSPLSIALHLLCPNCRCLTPAKQALFSVSHPILPNDAGATLYAILIVIFMVATYVVAFSLGLFLDVMQKPWHRLKERILARSSNGDVGIVDVMTGTEREERHGRVRERENGGGSEVPRGSILPLVRLNGNGNGKGRESSNGVV
jgi:hypothetical protein